MSFKIEDGGGTGNTAGVNKRQRLKVEASTDLVGHFVSLEDGQAFNVVSHTASAAAGQHILYLKNTSPTRTMFVNLLRVGASSAAVWKIWEVTGSAGTATVLTPSNLNLSSGILAEADSRGDLAVEGLTQGSQLAHVRHGVNMHADIPFDDILILGQNDAIAVEYDAGVNGSTAESLIRFYYKSNTEL